jgi:hypothetical protein
MRATECCARVVVMRAVDGSKRKRRVVLDETCGNPLPPRRRRFCSDECARRQERVERITETDVYGRAVTRQVLLLATRGERGDLDALAALDSLIKQGRAALKRAVAGSRSLGYSDNEIAAGMGLSRQNVERRFGMRPPTPTHGLSRHYLYPTWNMMIARCERPNNDSYQYYGERGIRVCERWHDVALFIEDIERDLGPRPDGMTLDRIDPDSDYGPGLVRWATAAQQRANQRPQHSVAAGQASA